MNRTNAIPILGVITTGKLRPSAYDGMSALIIGNHPHKGNVATCIGVATYLTGDFHVFKYNIPWVGTEQFCVRNLTDLQWQSRSNLLLSSS